MNPIPFEGQGYYWPCLFLAKVKNTRWISNLHLMIDSIDLRVKY
jgi:hypothetical protein